MAHEIAHVTARHATRNATKAELVQLASIGLIFIGGWPGFGVQQAASFLIPLKFLQFSRSAEREADFLGLQYMYKAGYDPNAFISFFEKVRGEEKKKPGHIPKAFSTHPPTPERITKAQEEIAQILPSRPEYIVTTSEFNEVKARLSHLQLGRKPKEGEPDRPTLRKQSERTDKDAQGSSKESPDDDRPVLKRKPEKPKEPDTP
jgi:predicted Zn-dependent protease